MITLWARTALLAEGWARDVRVDIGPDGTIDSVQPGAAPAGQILGVLLPAPVNAHSHAFQRAMAGLTERRGPDSADSFWTWRQLMFRFLDRLTPEHVEAIAAFVQMEMLEAGYATNVEFHYLHHQPGGSPYAHLAEMCERIVAATAQTGIGLTLLPVHYQYGGCDQRKLGPGQVRFGNDFERYARLHELAGVALQGLPPDCRLGVAPHSLRAVAAGDVQAAHALAGDGPIHMHLAEQQAEVDEVLACHGARPVEWFVDNGEPDARWCLIHCTQMQPHEGERLARSGAVAGLCPITESSLGDGIFDGVRWLSAGGQIAVGSDSNVRIALAEELRTLEYSQRLRDHSRTALATPEQSTGRVLFEAVCRGGAIAAKRNTGTLSKGRLADLLALDDAAIDLAERTGDAILDSYLFCGGDHLVREVWSAGRHLVRGGQHRHHAAITERYRHTLKSLRGAL